MKYIAAEYSNIDISQLDAFRTWAKANGKKYRIKFRGPRRPGPIGQATCLKKDALRFSAYPV